MKKIFGAIVLMMALTLFFTGCGLTVPRPEIKSGEFDITVTYEYNGEMKTASGVYVCEYDGIIWWDINAEDSVNWKESFEGDIQDDGIIPICTTDDGAEILISLYLSPEYFMGDPECVDWTPRVQAELWYPDDQIDDAALIAEYGVRLISYECDEPIKNVFK